MAVNLKYSTAAKTGQLTDLNTRIGVSALIALYDGAQPASPDTAVSTQNKLAQWTGNATQFGTVTTGVLTASAVANTTGLIAGTAAWFRISTSGGVAHMDGTAGTASADMILSSVTVGVGTTMVFNSLTDTGGN